jgi:hypothetical protein
VISRDIFSADNWAVWSFAGANATNIITIPRGSKHLENPKKAWCKLLLSSI